MMNDIKFGNSPLFSHILQAIPEEEKDLAQVVLLVVSAKGLQDSSGHTVNVRKINLSAIGKIAKLDRYREEHRLILAIQKGDQVYAKISDKIAKELEKKGQQLALNGKEIHDVQVVDQEEYLDELSKISEVLKETLKAADKEDKKSKNLRPFYKESIFKAPLLTPSDIQVLHMLAKIEGIPDKIKQRIVQRMLENQREIDREKEEQYEKDRIKVSDIKHKELKRSILKEEIKASEIEGRNTKITLTKDHVNKSGQERLKARMDHDLPL